MPDLTARARQTDKGIHLSAAGVSADNTRKLLHTKNDIGRHSWLDKNLITLAGSNTSNVILSTSALQCCIYLDDPGSPASIRRNGASASRCAVRTSRQVAPEVGCATALRQPAGKAQYMRCSLGLI